MADRALSPGLPPGAVAIVRGLTGAASATLYTVPATFRLRITHGWVSIATAGTPAAGSCTLVVNNAATAGLGILGDLGNARTLCGATCSTSAGSSSDNALSGIDVPCEAGTLVSMILTSAAGAQISAGFVGYLEPALPGQSQ